MMRSSLLISPCSLPDILFLTFSVDCLCLMTACNLSFSYASCDLLFIRSSILLLNSRAVLWKFLRSWTHSKLVRDISSSCSLAWIFSWSVRSKILLSALLAESTARRTFYFCRQTSSSRSISSFFMLRMWNFIFWNSFLYSSFEAYISLSLFESYCWSSTAFFSQRSTSPSSRPIASSLKSILRFNSLISSVNHLSLSLVFYW